MSATHWQGATAALNALGATGLTLADTISGAAGALLAMGEQIDRALAIHAPCHTEATEEWGCTFGHAGDDGYGKPGPDQPARCMACTYDDRDVTYPCPTALALGVEPTERPARP
jgi:hypothetical protein